MTAPHVRYDHLLRMSDGIGLFEHALGSVPRGEHGYCVDDAARGVLVIAREPRPTPELTELARRLLLLTVDAVTPDGRVHNRLHADEVWRDVPSTEDCWGRAIWGFGTAARRLPALSERALVGFDQASRQRSEWPRAMAFAALGAAEVVGRWPGHPAACGLLRSAVDVIGAPGDDPEWRWPEPRLRYANAALAEVLIDAGCHFDDPVVLRRGLEMLEWLAATETRGDHLSVTPVKGWTLGESRPAFDQQPIEVAAIADAAATAFDVTGDPKWRHLVSLAAGWFLGHNDAGVLMYDQASGGGFDGLHADRANANQGAESTLAALSTLQQAHRLGITGQRDLVMQARAGALSGVR